MSSFSRLVANAMLLLSADHATSLSGALVLVMRRGGLLPSTGTSHKSLTALSASYEGSNTAYTTHLPSGLTTGAPTRFIIHSASCVIGLVAAGISARDSSGSATQAAVTIAQNLSRCFIVNPGFELDDKRRLTPAADDEAAPACASL